MCGYVGDTLQNLVNKHRPRAFINQAKKSSVLVLQLTVTLNKNIHGTV